ncbi:PGC-1 and ERR-induced regulator in muscle protein 1 [Pogoniulus pusillus]|uniref:PGC-1 and ERR-induced regulator in muscle protein 1 n=1 Tax=Pogoniulus pusillus TaxID=488313 RepID=UPI0030B95ECD
MDDFEYSIQLSDRDWAEFYLQAEECDLAPAALATAEEQCLSDIDQGDSLPGRDCHASTNGQPAAAAGSGPELGTASSAPRGVPGGASPPWPAAGHLSLPELLSGSEDEVELGSVGRFLCDGDKPGCPLPTLMPSVPGRQPPCPPANPLASPAGGTAESSPGQNAACEAAAPQPAPVKGASGGSQAMEHPGQPAGGTAGAQPHGQAGAQPGAPVQDSLPALPASPKASARKSLGSSASRSDLGAQGSLRDPPPGPPPEAVPRAPSSPARERESRERTGTEPSSPDVVRPKVPGQSRKSRKQRGASGSEAAQGDREPAAVVAQGTGGAAKTPLSSPLSSRKSKGKEKAAKPALVKLGSEEAADSKQPVPGPGTDEGDPGTSTPLKQKVKEPGTQSLGKAKATKQPKPGQAGGLGVRDNVPVIPASEAAAPLAEACQEVPQEPPQPKRVVAYGGDAARGACGEPAGEVPEELGPSCFAAKAPARADTLDVTWPEMYDYMFCDSQGEEEEMWSSMEGEEAPLEREISLPELYEYFFNEPEGNRQKVKGKGRKRKKLSSWGQAGLREEPRSAAVRDSLVISVPEVYEPFFRDGPGSRVGWRRIFSVAPASEVKKAVGALKSLLQRHLVGAQAPAPQALLRRGSGEKLCLVPLAPLGREQAQPEGVDMALALRGGPETPLALTHKDMCLVFCAFASWAVKTSDLQAPDAWKTMFLASFGTLSAIRYFRRQVREGHPRI